MNINKLKNIHKGQACYIFGDGPSLKFFDLSKFNNYIGISCGMQAFHKDFKSLNIKYYALIEPFLFYPDWMLILKRLHYIKNHRIITNQFRTIIKDRSDITFIIHLSNIFSIIGSNICYAHKLLIKKSNNYSFTNENPFHGSFHATIFLAYFMGFSKIYLVGFDAWTRQPLLSERWYEKGKVRYRKINRFKIELFDELNSEIEIFNISIDGTACNINNILYEDYTNEKLNYKENVDIINPDYISLLAKRFNTIHATGRSNAEQVELQQAK